MNTNNITTYPQIQAIKHTDEYLKIEKQIKQSWRQFFKGVGFVAMVSIISENELIGFSFFEMNVVLGVAGGIFALQGFVKAYIANIRNKRYIRPSRINDDDGYNPALNHIVGSSSYRIFPISE